LSESKHQTTDGSLLVGIAQQYETGTDIPQIPTARASISIRKNMTKRDCLQSTFRMRQILLGQSGSYFLTPEVNGHIAERIWQGILQRNDEKIMACSSCDDLDKAGVPKNVAEALLVAKDEWQKTHGVVFSSQKFLELEDAFICHFSPDFAALWKYLTVNESYAEQKKNWIATQQRMRELIERPIREVLSETPDSDLIHGGDEFFNEVQEIFTDYHSESLFELVATSGLLQKTQEAIEQLCQKYTRCIPRIEARMSRCNTAATLFIEKLRAMYPPGENESLVFTVQKAMKRCANIEELPLLVESSHCVDQQLEIELEREQELQIQLQIQLQVQMLQHVLLEKPYTPITTITNNGYILEKLEDSVVKLPTVQEAKTMNGDKIFTTEISDRLHYSQNLFLDNRFNSLYALPGRYMLVVKRKDMPCHYVLISHEDAEKVKLGLLNCQSIHDCSMALITLDGQCVIGTSDASNMINIHSGELVLARVLGKLCTGCLRYSREESLVLDHELTKEPNVEQQKVSQLRIFFESILSTRSDAASSYPGTWIARRLRKCLK
jgi:hypothetical protein